jgi:hypothetical protein
VSRQHPSQSGRGWKSEVFEKMKAEETLLKAEMVEKALSMGATGAKAATREMLVGPPSGDLSYVLPGGRSAIAYAVPLGFIDTKEAQVTTLGGHEFSCSKKGNHMRCTLACSGLVGISQLGQWSTWATLRYRVPDDDQKLRGAFLKALKDPASEYIRSHVLSETFREGALFRSRKDTQPTCCNCALVCCGPRDERMELMQILHASGIVIRLPDGSEEAVPPETLNLLFTRDFTC